MFRGRSPGPSTTLRCRPAAPPSSRSRWMTGTVEADEDRAAQAPPGGSSRPRRARPGGARRRWPSGSPGAAIRCSSPALTSTPAAAGTPPSRWPSSSACRSGPRPATGRRADRVSREPPPLRRACLPPAIGAVSETLKDHDLVLVVGSSVFPYYPYIPGPLLAEGAELVAITTDPGEAARAPMGDAILGDVALALQRLTELVTECRPRAAAGPPRARRAGPGRPDERLGGDGRTGRRLARGRDRRARDPVLDAGAAQSPAASPAGQLLLRRQRRPRLRHLRRRRRAAGPARRPVVCVLGEGSAQYGITALWSAVAYKVPVTFLVLRNEEYMILKWFAMFEQVTGCARARPARARRGRRGRGLRHAGALRSPAARS